MRFQKSRIVELTFPLGVAVVWQAKNGKWVCCGLTRLYLSRPF